MAWPEEVVGLVEGVSMGSKSELESETLSMGKKSGSILIEQPRNEEMKMEMASTRSGSLEFGMTADLSEF